MVGCWAVGCSNRSELGKQVFSFPKDPYRKNIWAKKVNRLDPNSCNNAPRLLQPSNFAKLCEDHFERHTFIITDRRKRRLKKDAVPTLFSHLQPQSGRADGDNEYVDLRAPSSPYPVAHLQDPPPATAPATPGIIGILVTGQQVDADGEHTVIDCSATGAFRSMVTGCLYTEQQPAVDVSDDEAAEAQADCTAVSLTEADCTAVSLTEADCTAVSLTEADCTAVSLTEADCTAVPLTEAHSTTLPLSEKSQIEKLQKKNAILIRRLKQAKRSQLNSERCLKRLENSINKIFTSDQLEVLKCRSRRGLKWQIETVNRALRFYFSCGVSGYEELLASGFPLPSVRTLQKRIAETRESVEVRSQSESGSKQTSPDSNSMLEDCSFLSEDVGGEEEITTSCDSMLL